MSTECILKFRGLQVYVRRAPVGWERVGTKSAAEQSDLDTHFQQLEMLHFPIRSSHEVAAR